MKCAAIIKEKKFNFIHKIAHLIFSLCYLYVYRRVQPFSSLWIAFPHICNERFSHIRLPLSGLFIELLTKIVSKQFRCLCFFYFGEHKIFVRHYFHYIIECQVWLYKIQWKQKYFSVIIFDFHINWCDQKLCIRFYWSVTVIFVQSFIFVIKLFINV